MRVRPSRACTAGVAAAVSIVCLLSVSPVGVTTARAAAAAAPSGYWTGDPDAAVPESLPGGKVIRARGVLALMHKGGAVIVDVSSAPRRPPQLAPGALWLPVPHRAIPGALWIPGAGAGQPPAPVEGFYRDRLQAASGGDFDRPLIVYCHARCWLSWNAAKRAVAMGYRRVFWFADGIEGWTRRGLATVVVAPEGPVDRAGALGAEPGPARASLPQLVVLDIELTGDLGGPDFAAEHEARLRKESARLTRDLEASGLYRIMDNGPAQATLDQLRSSQRYLHDCNGCDLDVGRQLGADLVFVSWVDRVSGLILSLTYEIHDVKSGQIAARKSFDFRGDNDLAWDHAIDYMVRDLKASAAVGSGAL